MSTMEEGPLPLGELLAEEKLRWTSMANAEADCVVEKDSIPKYLYLSHERNKISRFKFNKRVSGHQISNGRSMDFGEDGYFMHKPGSGWVKDEMLKCRQTGASGGDHLEEYGGDFVNNRFEEENFDFLWKSGSLSNEPLIHQKKNMSFKGTTWICSQDQASFTSRRKFYDSLRSKTPDKILKNIRRKRLPMNGTFENAYETILHGNQRFVDETGNNPGASARYGGRPRKSSSLDNRFKGFTNSKIDLIPEESPNKCKGERSLPKCSSELDQDGSVPLLDQAAFRAVVSIISAYIGQFMRDNSFRKTVVRNCYFCLGFSEQEELDLHNDGFVVTLKRAMDSVERVVDGSKTYDELKKAKVQLSVIADLNSDDLKDGRTCGIPNSCLAACAHLYLGVLFKIQKKGKVAAKHIVQVFCSSPFQARSLLLAELWGYLFLPHLLYLRVWYSQELESTDYDLDRSRKMKLLDKAYNELLDDGTYKLAVYYKEWLSDRVEVPAIPSVRLPYGLAYGISNEEFHGAFSVEEKSIAKESNLQPTAGKSLFESVFGYSGKDDYADERRHWKNKWKFGSCSRSFNCVTERNDEVNSHYSTTPGGMQHIMLNEARDIPTEDAIHECGLLLMPEDPSSLPVSDSVAAKELMANQHVSCGNDFALKKKLVETVSRLQPKETFDCYLPAMVPLPPTVDVIPPDLATQSDGIYKSGIGGTEIASACINSFSPYPSAGLIGMDSLSNTSDDFVCPLTSKLFEDPVTFESWKAKNWKHLRATYTQPVSSAMPEHDYYADESAISLLEQLLSSSNPEENKEHAKHFISLGGLLYLIQKFESVNLEEKRRAILLILNCIKADAGCRNYLVAKINKSTIIQLLLQSQSRVEMVVLLTELVCLDRRLTVTNFLHGLQKEGAINLMHCLLVDLQSSPSEQRPLISMLLLHLVVMQEDKGCSIYREEALDALVEALEGSLLDEKARVQTCRALLILEGLFSCTGEGVTEAWLLKLAGFKHPLTDSLLNNENKGPQNDVSLQEQEEEARQQWLRNMASIFFVNGKELLWEAFSKCLVCGVPELARACLVFVTWLSCALGLLSCAQMKLRAFSILAPTLKECLLNDDKVACQALASLSLLNFIEDSKCWELFMTFAGEINDTLESISEVIRSAKQLNAMISRGNCFRSGRQ